jgi:hypothetical protein
MPDKDDEYSCSECGAEVVCVTGSGCGVKNYIMCCGHEMKKKPARDSPTEKEA